MRKTSAALLAALVLATVAACGSSSSPSNNSAESSSSATASASAPSATATSPAASGANRPQSAQRPTGGAKVAVSTATVAGLGTILVNAQGHTLYTFVPDHAAKVTCVSSCALVWPPAKLATGEQASGSGGVHASLLGSDADPEGGQVITYHGWPLYTYVADSGAGTAAGQALNVNGGLWYAIAPSGEVIQRKP
ncbi:MAG: COG4315 family predicted lipoprotein [Solirubrobacteraceae bacterium]